MPLNYKTSGGGNFKSVAAGNYVAICNMVADLGVQPGSGMYPEPKHQVYIRFEIPAERVDYEKDGKKLNGPAVVGSTFTASMNEKANLRKQLEGWRGRKFTDDEANAFDVSTILGKPCMLNVVEKVSGDKVYSNIASISPMPKGITAPPHENTLLFYCEDDRAAFKLLPDWLQKKINEQVNLAAQKEPEYQQHPPDYDYGFTNQNGLEITDDDIPF